VIPTLGHVTLAVGSGFFPPARTRQD
jgi:hypothetical protein